MDKLFLFSVDLEDVRLGVDGGESYSDRVEINTLKYLEWLKDNNSKCTFFTTGHVAKNHPNLINKIVNEGHEVGCHTTNHIPLDKHTPQSLKKDLIENIKLLKDAGAKNIQGFRAPVLSLVENTKWAYDVLAELGFSYSSSVLPANNPLYGWKSFGEKSKKVTSSIVEIPISVGSIGSFSFPMVGGIYFRVLPFFLLKQIIKQHPKDSPIISYFHPYDIDVCQEKFMHSGINNSKFYNFLMYYNRKNLLNRLDFLVKDGYQIKTYANYIEELGDGLHV